VKNKDCEDMLRTRADTWKGLQSIGTGCPGEWWSHHPWRYLKDM